MPWAAAAALTAWFGALAAITVVMAPTATVLVVGPPMRAVLAAARAGFPVVDLGAAAIRVRIDGPAAVLALYREGAWLVLPAPPGGCFGVPTATRRG